VSLLSGVVKEHFAMMAHGMVTTGWVRPALFWQRCSAQVIFPAHLHDCPRNFPRTPTHVSSRTQCPIVHPVKASVWPCQWGG